MRQYIRAEAKRLLLTLPGFLTVLSGTLLLFALTVFLTESFLPEVLEVAPFRVGICAGGEDITINYISEYIKQMESTEDLVEFQEIPFQEMLEEQEISRRKVQEIMGEKELTACIVIPERTAESVMDGTNIPVQVFVEKSADSTERYLQQRLLTLLTEYSAVLIDVPQAETLLLYEMQAENPEETGRVLDLFHFGLVLGREDWFEKETVSAFDSIDADAYYLAAGAALLFIFWGLGSGSFFRNQERDLPLLLERQGIPLPFQQGVKQVLYILWYLIPVLALTVASKETEMAVPALLCGVMLSLQCSFFFELAPSAASGVVVNCIWGFAAFLGAGGMLPAVFLPEFLTKACGGLPAGICLELSLQCAAGKRSADGSMMGLCLLWCMIFGALGQFVFWKKQRSRS